MLIVLKVLVLLRLLFMEIVVVVYGNIYSSRDMIEVCINTSLVQYINS